MTNDAITPAQIPCEDTPAPAPVPEAPVSQPETGEQTGAPEKGEDLNAQFEALIRGKFRDQFSRKIQAAGEAEQKYRALLPALEALGKKYGVDGTDPQALSRAIAGEVPKQPPMDRESAVRAAQLQYDQWIRQEQALKQVYPGFDLRAELQNPDFARMIRNDIAMDAAYVALHKDEIIPAAMAATARAVRSQIAKNLASGGARPSENGMGHQASAVTRTDVSRLSKQDIEQVIRRVAKGERVSFG